MEVPVQNCGQTRNQPRPGAKVCCVRIQRHVPVPPGSRSRCSPGCHGGLCRYGPRLLISLGPPTPGRTCVIARVSAVRHRPGLDIATTVRIAGLSLGRCISRPSPAGLHALQLRLGSRTIGRPARVRSRGSSRPTGMSPLRGSSHNCSWRPFLFHVKRRRLDALSPGATRPSATHSLLRCLAS